jgi:hypothetical protein
MAVCAPVWQLKKYRDSILSTIMDSPAIKPLKSVEDPELGWPFNLNVRNCDFVFVDPSGWQ